MVEARRIGQMRNRPTMRGLFHVAIGVIEPILQPVHRPAVRRTGFTALIIAPGDTANWKGPYLRKTKLPKDPWGNDYKYELTDEGERVIVINLGKDGRKVGEGENVRRHIICHRFRPGLR